MLCLVNSQDFDNSTATTIIMSTVWSIQPFKAAYTSVFLLTAPFHLLLLATLYTWKPLRPVPEWSVRRNFSRAMLRKAFQLITTTRAQYALYDEPKASDERCVKVEPLKNDDLTGVLAATNVENPSPLDAVWFPKPIHQGSDSRGLENEKVVLHFPGGAYVMAFGYKRTGKEVAELLSKHLNASRTLWAQYRLSDSSSQARFPAALQDAVSFYRYVVQLGVSPHNIILTGDSAGGNLVLALLRYLETDHTLGLPLPGGAVIFSPWVNITADAPAEFAQASRSYSDYIIKPLLQWGVDSFLPAEAVDQDTQAYISPMHHPFKVSSPLFIHAGNYEALYEDIKSFAREMMNEGSNVAFSETMHAPHDLLMSHMGFQLTRELEDTLDSAFKHLDAKKKV